MRDDGQDGDLHGRFINATERIRTALSRQYGQEFGGVGQARRHALENRHQVVMRNDSTLRALIDLRNVLQHSHMQSGRPIATPRADAVEAIEEIADQVENAPKVNRFMVKHPTTVAPSDSLAKVSHLVVAKALSQIPVCLEGTYIGLLTTNALARWLADAITREEGNLIGENVVVQDILDCAEHHEVAEFVAPTMLASKACHRLTADEAPVALLVTTDGRPSGAIQGILTRFDVPRILQPLRVQFPRPTA